MIAFSRATSTRRRTSPCCRAATSRAKPTAPSPAELGYFVSLLAGSGGSMMQAELLEVAATLDLNLVNINLAGLQQTGVDFI